MGEEPLATWRADCSADLRPDVYNLRFVCFYHCCDVGIIVSSIVGPTMISVIICINILIIIVTIIIIIALPLLLLSLS